MSTFLAIFLLWSRYCCLLIDLLHEHLQSFEFFPIFYRFSDEFLLEYITFLSPSFLLFSFFAFTLSNFLLLLVFLVISAYFFPFSFLFRDLKYCSHSVVKSLIFTMFLLDFLAGICLRYKLCSIFFFFTNDPIRFVNSFVQAENDRFLEFVVFLTFRLFFFIELSFCLAIVLFCDYSRILASQLFF